MVPTSWPPPKRPLSLAVIGHKPPGKRAKKSLAWVNLLVCGPRWPWAPNGFLDHMVPRAGRRGRAWSSQVFSLSPRPMDPNSQKADGTFRAPGTRTGRGCFREQCAARSLDGFWAEIATSRTKRCAGMQSPEPFGTRNRHLRAGRGCLNPVCRSPPGPRFPWWNHCRGRSLFFLYRSRASWSPCPCASSKQCPLNNKSSEPNSLPPFLGKKNLPCWRFSGSRTDLPDSYVPVFSPLTMPPVRLFPFRASAPNAS